MAYNKEKIFKQALKLTKLKGIHFIEDVVARLPITKTSFYEYFTIGSDEMNAIKDSLSENVVRSKQRMRKKWEEGDNATLQLANYKLIGDQEERKKLSVSYHEHESPEGTMTPQQVINLSNVPDDVLQSLLNSIKELPE